MWLLVLHKGIDPSRMDPSNTPEGPRQDPGFVLKAGRKLENPGSSVEVDHRCSTENVGAPALGWHSGADLASRGHCRLKASILDFLMYQI